MRIRLGLTAALLAALPTAATAQGVGGTVVDASTNLPLAGAQVLLEGTPRGMLTAANGRFAFPDAAGPRVRVRVILIGYREWQGELATGRTDHRIALEPRAVELSAVVVTGTPQAERVRALGNSVGRLRAADLQQVAPRATVHALLGAEVPGVQVALSRGEVGAGANIRIRGANSMSLPSEPLVYVDGVRVNGNATDFGGAAGVGTDARTPPSRINDISPEDIESVEIIKGPAAATLYGTEASNGVIQIITKRGAQGRPTFHATLKQGATWLPDPERLFPPVYYVCRGTSGKCTPGQIVEFNVLRSDRERGLGPWFHTGRPRGAALNVSGGTEGLKYYFSLDWDRDEGPVTYNWLERLSGRANLSWTPSARFGLDFGLGGVRSTLQSASAQQPVTTAIIWACPAPGCEPGSKTPNAVDGPMRGYIGYLPERYERDIEGFQDVDRTTFSLTANHRPTGWLSHRLVLGGDFTGTHSTELYRRTTEPGTLYPLGRKQVADSHTTYASLDYGATATLAVTPTLRLATSAGTQYYLKRQDYIFGQGEVFPVRQLETVTSGSVKTVAEDFVENKSFGAYVQEQLAWRDRVFLTAAVRGDDNSAFGKNFDFVVYPKLSASWVASEEPFLARRLPFLGTLRLRAAWGRAGQQPETFAALRTYEPTLGPGGTPALTPQNLGNPDLEPEVGEELEVGVDASALEERIGLEFTVYDQTTRNAIVRVPALPSLGFPGVQFRNLGRIANHGIELALRTTPYRARNVGLDLNVTYATTHNRVEEVGTTGPFVMNATFGQYHVPGFPMGSIFTWRVVSADTVTVGGRRIARNLLCEGGERIPGSNLSRGGGPPVPCAEAPLVYWGSPLPTWQGGASATLTLFGSLQLYALVEYVGGHHMINGDISGGHTFFGNTRAILERKDPILLGYEALRNGFIATGVMDAGFAKLRRVSASYTFPSRWTARYGASRATLTLSAENLATLWQATHEIFGRRVIDPEQRNSAGSGNDPGGLLAYNQEGWPQLRRFLTTLRVTF